MPRLESTRARLAAIAEARCAGAGPAHDFAHVLRVVANARRISKEEGADPEVTEPAALLHELFNYPKGHAESHRSGEVCAEHARDVLRAVAVPPARIDAIVYAIRVHPFSLGIEPVTLEARVLQDADRLDAIGAIGIARCFATCADLRRPFYHPDDPLCRQRPPDDKAWGVDHFFQKLLRIPDRLHTAAARVIAAERTRFLHTYLGQLEREIGPG